MDFKQLTSFIEIVNLKSFSKASAKLYLTQPTVTNHIQKLEEELDVILLNRTGREVTPTEPGSLFYNYAQEMVNLKASATYKLNAYKSKIQGNIEINSSSIPSQYILPYIIKDFKFLYPDVFFKINQTDSKNVINSIKDGYSNFGIVGAKYNIKNVEYTELMEDRLVLALPSTYADKFSPFDTINLNQLESIPLILREEGSGSRYMIEEELLKLGTSFKNLKIVTQTSNNDTIKKMIELNIGASFISQLAIKKEISSRTIIPVEISDMNLKRNFYFVCHNKRFLSPLSKTFKDFVLDYNISE
ncbi:selenium metabolism-associated LysR family transcriptional regulator [Clostridium sp. DL1XJH146]